MGNNATYYLLNKYTWFRNVYIILQEGPDVIAWVYFFKICTFISKPSM